MCHWVYRSTVWFKISIYSESLISDCSAPCLLRKWTKFEYSNTLNPPLIWNRDTHEYMRNLYGTNTRVFGRSIPTSSMPQLPHFKYCKYSHTQKTKRHLKASQTTKSFVVAPPHCSALLMNREPRIDYIQELLFPHIWPLESKKVDYEFRDDS